MAPWSGYLHLQIDSFSQQRRNKTLFWKRYIDDVFSLQNTRLEKIESFVEKANNFHSTIKFTAAMSETEINVLGHKSVQRGQIRQGIKPGTPNVNFLFGRRLEIQNFRNICCKISCLPASLNISEHLKNGIIAHF